VEAAKVEHLKQPAERNARSEVAPAFVRIARAKEISGVSKATLLRWIEAGEFPAPVVRSGNTVLWDWGEILAWREAQFQKRRERGEA
jgi:predicted DNA-binding transcriptional regulator AlpA